MPRRAPVKVYATESPNTEVKTQLERDALYFLEHPGKVAYVRPICIGETEEFDLPPQATVVRVTRSERAFIVGGVTTLIIARPEAKAKRAKKRRQHMIFDLTRVRHDPIDPPQTVDRAARTRAEHERQAARRAEKQAQRAAIIAAKRGA